MSFMHKTTNLSDTLSLPSSQDFTTIFSLRGSSEAKKLSQYYFVGIFVCFFFVLSPMNQHLKVSLHAVGCILINHGAFSLYPLALV